MVTKLNDNLSYIKYIQKKVEENFPNWEEVKASYESELNDNFGITFIIDSYKISLIKDRGLLELLLFNNNGLVSFGYLLFNSIMEKIPDQDTKWRTSICVELIDFYIEFLKKYFVRM